MKRFLREDFARFWHGKDMFAEADKLQGEIFRQVKGRRTLRFEQDGKSFFVKVHPGVGWGEIIKNLITFRLPVVGAGNEWRAINALQSLGIPTMTVAAYGERGLNPATRYSFLVTDDLSPAVSLETWCAGWANNRPDFRFKVLLIQEVARLARQLHANGICHRDFYLCHFLLRCAPDGKVDESQQPHLSMIDLHRTLIKPAFVARWVKKDLAGLHFSALDTGLTRTDFLRFMCAYTGKPVREIVQQELPFWRSIQRKARKIWLRDRKKQDRKLQARIYNESEAVAVQRADGKFALVNKRLWQPGLQPLIDSPDALIKKAQMIKDGDSTTVVALSLAGREWVIKRYNLKGFWYGVSRLLRPSRAWHCWESAFRLHDAGIHTPQPLLMLEKRWGPLRREAYYVCERVRGKDAKLLLDHEPLDSDVWSQTLTLFEDLFVMMRKQRVVHGDMKSTNFLLCPQDDGTLTLEVIDLDACRLELKPSRFRKYFSRDLLRFYANWRHHEAAGKVSQLIKKMGRGL